MYSREPLRMQDGIHAYADKDFYWDNIDREKMREFIQLGKRVGFVQARKGFSFGVEHPGKLHQYMDNFARADFHFFLPLDRDATVLDLGSGYGNITIPLAKHYRRVVAVDTSVELLEFVKLRAESEGLTNIEFVHSDPFEYGNLPFTDKSFDAVVVSGVLEWVGAAKLDEPPSTLQQNFLSQVRRFVKEDGILYVAIENRLYPGFIHRDPHSKLHFTSILPRPLANWYAKFKGRADGYRTYIYSAFGYRRLLRRAGFPHISFLYPFSGYRSPTVIWPNRSEAASYVLRGPLGAQLYTRKWLTLLRFCEKLGETGLFLLSFMMIASSSTNRQPMLLRMMQGMQGVTSDDVILKTLDAEGETSATFLLFHTGEHIPYATAHVPRIPSVDESIRIEPNKDYVAR